MVALITAIAQHVQKIENAFYPLDQYRQLAFSYGQQLDNIGQVIGQSRNGLTDAQYSVLLYGKIAENFSDSTSIAILNIIAKVFQASSVFLKTPDSLTGIATQAQVAFGVGNPQLPDTLFNLAINIVQNSLGASINITYISEYDTDGCFACAGNQQWTQPTGPTFTPSVSQPWPFGCGDINNPYVGGPCPSLLYDDNVFDNDLNTVITTEDFDILTTEDGDRLIT
jgi:hypothetical protein